MSDSDSRCYLGLHEVFVALETKRLCEFVSLVMVWPGEQYISGAFSGTIFLSLLLEILPSDPALPNCMYVSYVKTQGFSVSTQVFGARLYILNCSPGIYTVIK